MNGDGIGEFSTLHCSSEWHIAQLRSHLAMFIHNIALRVAGDGTRPGKSGRFSASIPRLAEYFRTDERTIRRGIKGLVTIDFFRPLAKENGHMLVYQPISHRQWEKDHPGECLEKIDLLYDSDLLGRALFAACDGRIKFFYPNVLRAMRNTGLSDLEILESIKEFRQLDVPTDPKMWARGFVARFIKHLKIQAKPL